MRTLKNATSKTIAPEQVCARLKDQAKAFAFVAQELHFFTRGATMALISKFVYKLLMNFLSSLQVRPNQNMRCLCKSGVNHGKQLQINYAIPLDFGQIGWRKLQVVAHIIYIFCFWVQTIFYLSFFQFSCFTLAGSEACVIT